MIQQVIKCWSCGAVMTSVGTYYRCGACGATDSPLSDVKSSPTFTTEPRPDAERDAKKWKPTKSLVKQIKKGAKSGH